MAAGTVGRRAQRGRRTRRRRPLRAAHHDRNRTPARHRLLVSRLRAGQRVRPDRGWPDLDGRPPAGRIARSGAGRHFVGRGLQRTARTVDDAVGYLRSRPSAGGFSYTIGDRAGRVVSVEAAAGRHAVAEAGPGRPAAVAHQPRPLPLRRRARGRRHERGPRRDAGRPRRPGRGPRPVLVPGRPRQPAAGRRPLRPRAGRPRADHAVHARRRPDRGGGRDRRARRAARHDPAGRPGRRQPPRPASLPAREVLAG